MTENSGFSKSQHTFKSQVRYNVVKEYDFEVVYMEQFKCAEYENTC